MLKFSSTHLRTKSNDVYRAVEVQQVAEIKHRDRGDMVLMSKDLLNKLLSSETQREVFKELHA